MDVVRGVAFLLAALSALAAAVSVAGALNARADVATHATPVWLAAALAALALHLIGGGSGDGGTVILGGTAAFAGLVLIGPEVILRLSELRAAPLGQTLKVIQFNVWDRNRDPGATARWLRAQDADLVVLEEADGPGRRVAQALADCYPFQAGPERGRGSPTVILAKTRPAAGGPIVFEHLKARYSGAWAVFGEGARAFGVIGMHYAWPWPPRGQDVQARRFADLLADFDRDSLIVAGDFNLTPWSFALRRGDARLGLRRLTRALATWPAGPVYAGVALPFPVLPIDHVYAGRAWRVVSLKRGPRLGSDHYPVVVVLTR